MKCQSNNASLGYNVECLNKSYNKQLGFDCAHKTTTVVTQDKLFKGSMLNSKQKNLMFVKVSVGIVQITGLHLG